MPRVPAGRLVERRRRIVVHTDIKTIADLRGKTVVLAQIAVAYFLLNALLNGGVQPPR